MSRRILLLGLILALPATAAQADDLKGASSLLCASVQATRCSPDGECVSGPPWNWNIPQFIEIHLDEKVLRTTEASGENRATPIKNIEREDGLIFLQGVESGRAFSFAIEEETGGASIAVARGGLTVSVFGSCTPKTAP